MFNIVWGYIYSIRLFLIEAKHRYKGTNINRKHTLKIYKVQKVYFQSALAWIRSSAINERNVSLIAERYKSCVRSFTGGADLNLAGLCWVSCHKFSDAVMMILSGQSVISRVYTSWFGNGTHRHDFCSDYKYDEIPLIMHHKE